MVCLSDRLAIFFRTLALVLASVTVPRCQAAAPGSDSAAASPRYGTFGLLDRRSRYGQYWFPEPFRLAETDVDNELRFDWVHQEGKGRVADGAKVEIEKSFGLMTLELEAPYTRETLATIDSVNGKRGHERSEGMGNVEISARHPVHQYVSANGFFDNTVVFALEVGIPTNSRVSKNAEVVGKIFNDLRLGEHFSVQTELGYSVLLGSGADGGKHTFEYGAVFGYSFERQDLGWPGIERVIPIFELKGETGLNKEDAGHNNLSGTLGVRVNLKSFGALQPRLGVGYVFPLDKAARDEFRWGIVTSLVFEF